jgi:hypothetical protein
VGETGRGDESAGGAQYPPGLVAKYLKAYPHGTILARDATMALAGAAPEYARLSDSSPKSHPGNHLAWMALAAPGEKIAFTRKTKIFSSTKPFISLAQMNCAPCAGPLSLDCECYPETKAHTCDPRIRSSSEKIGTNRKFR